MDRKSKRERPTLPARRLQPPRAPAADAEPHSSTHSEHPTDNEARPSGTHPLRPPDEAEKAKTRQA